jgi:hypothetical protein
VLKKSKEEARRSDRENAVLSSTHIYALLDPRVGQVFYVGKANNPIRRLRWGYSNPKVRERVLEIKDAGLAVVQKVLETINVQGDLVKQDWVPREKFWIAQFSGLLNDNAGGGGPTSHTVEVRAKISRLHKGRVWPVEVRRAVAAGVSRFQKERRLQEQSQYQRVCPSCGKELEYKARCVRNAAERRKLACKSCAGVMRQTGIKPSDLTRKKRSEANRLAWERRRNVATVH